MLGQAVEHPFRTELRRLLLIPVAALLLFAGFLVLGILALTRSAYWVDHTDLVIAAANQLQTVMIDQETGARGFLLSRNPLALEPWTRGAAQAPAAFQQLSGLVADDPSQIMQLEVIRHNYASWQHLWTDRLGHPDSPEGYESVLATKVQMDEIRHEVDRFVQVEQTLKIGRTSRSRRDLGLLLIASGLFAVPGGLGLSFWLFRRITILNDTNEEREREREQSRQALSESELRLKTFANSIPTLAWMAHADGGIFWYNQPWYDYTGTAPDQMKGWGWQSVHDPVMLPGVMERWKSAVRTGKPFEMVFPLRSAAGELRAFLTRVAPFRNAEGEITQWFGTNTEIEELEKTRRALATERGRLAAVIDHMPLGLVFADDRGVITGGNLQVERLLRHPILFSQDISEYDQWISFHANGRQVEGHEYPLARTLEDGAIHSGEYLYQRGDGTKAWMQFTSAPIFDEQNRNMGAVVATLDIDARKRAEDELREKSELIDLVQTAVNAGYWSYHPTVGECFLSPGEQVLFGIRDTNRPAISQMLDRIHVADRDGVIQALEEGMQSGVYYSEFRVHREDGTLRWLAGQGRVLTRHGGEKYMVGMNFDVTNQKITEEALRKSEKLAVAGRLAASIAHEINNPLEAVTNLLYIVRTNTNDRETQEHIATAEDELARVSQIVTQSLRFHRQSTVPTSEQISAITESAANIYKSRLTSDRIQIRRDYQDTHLVCCYASELRQVFGNFISNAFDALKQGGTIVIRTRNTIDWQTGQPGVRATVADTGHGMDEATLRRIFEPFYTTKGINGTGLGLWISRDILKKHNAKLKVRSARQGLYRGTVFSILVPLDATRESSEVKPFMASQAQIAGVPSR